MARANSAEFGVFSHIAARKGFVVALGQADAGGGDPEPAPEIPPPDCGDRGGNCYNPPQSGQATLFVRPDFCQTHHQRRQ